MSAIKINRFNSAVFVLSVAAISVGAQTHFTFTSHTGNNMTVIVQTTINPTINGTPLATGDEIGIFTPAGLCVGARVWDSVHNRSITVWGDNDRTPTIIDGMIVGDTLSYRIWDSSLAQELPATATYDTAAPATAKTTYAVNGIAILTALFAPSLPQKPLLVSPSNTATITANSAVFIWFKGLPLINKYSLEIATDSLMSLIISSDSSITDTVSVCNGFTNGTSYWWRVKAHNTSGWGSYSDIFKFTVNSTAVVLPKSYSLNFYGMPNARSLITYALPVPSQVSIRLYNIQGKFIATLCNSYQASGYYQIPANLTALSKGFYVLSFTAGAYEIQKKLLNF